MSDETPANAPETTPSNDAALWDDSEGGDYSSQPTEEASAEATQSEPVAASPTERQRDEHGRFVASGATATPAEPSLQGSTAEQAQAPKTWSILGRDYTLEQLQDLAEQGHLDRMARTAEQFPYLQQKYQQYLEQSRAYQQSQAQQAQAPQGVQFSPQAIQAYYAPQMARDAQSGAIEKDLVDLFPGAVAQTYFQRDMLVFEQQQRAALEQRLQAIESREWETYQGNQVANVHSTLNTLFDAVAKRGGPFSELSDPNARAGFLDHLANIVNPTVDRLTEDFLAQQFAGYRSQKWVDAANALNAAQMAADKEKARLASGEGSGPRPAPLAPNPIADELAEMFSADY